jgi:hypothetical protein
MSRGLGPFGSRIRAAGFTLGHTAMTSFMYRCPNTGAMVQGFVVVEDIPECFNFGPEDGPYESIYCEMCRQAHIVNVRTGKVLGADDDDVVATNSG